MPSLRRLLLLAVILLVGAIAASYYYFEVARIRELQDAIGEREVILRERRDSLKETREKVEFYKTREGIEHLAREQYNLVGEGERVFLLQSPDRHE